jgi:putative ABC transport system permease protein
MDWLNRLRRRLAVLFRRECFDHDLEEELQFHLELQAEENQETGMAAGEALCAARRQFGNAMLIREHSYENWGWGAIERLSGDLRFALRMMGRNPGFTAVAVLVLALGIGANTAVFSVVNALLLNPFPFAEPERLVIVEARHVSGWKGTGYRDFLDWREQNAVFQDMAIVGWTSAYTLTGRGEPERVTGTRATEGFLRVLGVQPLLGRFFSAEEDRPGAPGVVVLTYAAWQRRFGASPDVLGHTITLDGKLYTIIGVMPRRFAFPGLRICDFWEPLRENPANNRYQHQYSVLARLKPGITLKRAQADMTAIARRLEREYPETNTGWGAEVVPAAEALAQETRRPVTMLFSTVVLVLMLACANVAGLMLARASGRAKEIAIRVSLGASRGRIVRQMLTESVLVAVVGGGLGLVFAQWLMDILSAAVARHSALETTLRLDGKVLWFTVAIAVLTGIVFGLGPALYGSKAGPNTILKGVAQAWSGARSRSRFLSGLVAGEVALALVLLAGAGLLVKDFLLILSIETGVRVEHLLTFSLELPGTKYSAAQRTPFYQGLLARLRAEPGVEGAGAVACLPMTGAYSGGGFEIEGRPKPADWMEVSAQYNTSTPGYFRTMGIPVLRGRDFGERDTAGALPVAIINDTLAKQFFPDEDPIGRRISYQGWRTIVGVAGSVKHQQPMRPPVPMIYAPHAQSPQRVMWVTVRAEGDPSKLAAMVRGAVRAADAGLPVLKMRTMREVVSDSLSAPKLMASFLVGFAAFALVLTAVGIYGVIAYSVTGRKHEIGVRISLGASRLDVLALVGRKGVLLAGAGVAAGLPAALAASRVLASLLYGVGPRDLTVFAGVSSVLVAVALAASCLPARRASKIDPVEALRCE